MTEKDEFFVGYLNTPEGLVGFYKILIPGLLIIAIACGVWVASVQPDAGRGVWDLSGEVNITGYLTVDPYPVIHFVGEGKRSVILVQQGKHSATEAARSAANQWVSVSGFAISRGDWSMLELLPSSEFLIKKDNPRTDYSGVSMGNVVLEGEIIDSKCFLGVMKPGAGKAHRACAAMCLRGGMPPMFVVKNNKGDRFGYMLMQEDGTSASLDLIDNVALPVRLTGSLERRGDILYIRYSKGSVSRLAGNELTDYGQTLVATNVGVLSHPAKSFLRMIE